MMLDEGFPISSINVLQLQDVLHIGSAVPSKKWNVEVLTHQPNNQRAKEATDEQTNRTNKPTYKQNKQASNQTTNWPKNERTNRRNNQPIKQTNNQNKQAINQPTNQRTKEQTDETTNRSNKLTNNQNKQASKQPTN